MKYLTEKIKVKTLMKSSSIILDELRFDII